MKTWTKSKPQWTQHQLWETRMRRRLNQCFCSHCLCQVSKKFKKSASLSDFSFRDNYATSPYQQENLWETIVALRGCDVKPMFVFPVSREIGALWNRSISWLRPVSMLVTSGHHGKCMDGAFEIQLCCCSSFFNRSFPRRTFGTTSKYTFCIVSAL